MGDWAGCEPDERESRVLVSVDRGTAAPCAARVDPKPLVDERWEACVSRGGGGLAGAMPVRWATRGWVRWSVDLHLSSRSRDWLGSVGYAGAVPIRPG